MTETFAMMALVAGFGVLQGIFLFRGPWLTRAQAGAIMTLGMAVYINLCTRLPMPYQVVAIVIGPFALAGAVGGMLWLKSRRR